MSEVQATTRKRIKTAEVETDVVTQMQAKAFRSSSMDAETRGPPGWVPRFGHMLAR